MSFLYLLNQNNVQQKIIFMKKLFTLIALVVISYSSMAQWLPQASGFTTPSRGIMYMHAVNDQVAWASAYDGSGSGLTINEFTHTSNAGDLWTPGQVLGGNVYGIGNICGISADIAYVTIYKGSGNQDNSCGVYKTSNGGTTWVQLPGALQGSASFANNVFFWNEQEGMCHGDVKDGYFEIYTTTNGGTTWTRVPQANITGGSAASGEGGWTSVIEAAGDNTIMFGTNKGKVYISDDRGFHWRVTNANITPATNGGINMIAFTDPNHGLVGQTVAPVALRRTSDGGATWQTVEPAGPFLTNDLAAVPGTLDTYVSTGAATGATGVSYSTDGGDTWTMFPDTDATQFLALDFYNTEVGWAGGFNESETVGGIFKFNGSLADLEGPTNLTASVTNQDVTLNWTAPTNPGGTFLGYNVYRTGISIAQLPTSQTNYVDTNLPNGTYSYYVTAVYEGGESAPTNTVEVEITGGSNLTTINLTFEDQADFDLTFGDWTALDVDGASTYGFEGITFPHSGEPMAFIAFNPLATTPAVTGMTAHGGARFGASFAANPAPNNDWLISPQIDLGINPAISMWVKSYTSQYGLEKYNILVSTTDMNPSSFTLLEGPLSAPADDWAYVTYSLDAYVGQQVYVAIQCVSNDAFVFMVDDISISFITATNDIPVVENLMVYPNPSNGILNVKGDSKFNKVQLVNLAGQVVYESNVTANETAINTSNITKGLYMLNITSDLGVVTRKVSIR
jgi:hypothetical protein